MWAPCGDPLVLALAWRARVSGESLSALEESENNLPDVLDKSAMHPHNRQFSTEGCPSG